MKIERRLIIKLDGDDIQKIVGASMDASDPSAGTSHWRSAAETGRVEAFS